MKNNIVIFFLLFHFSSIYAQDWGRYWCFGDSAGINFSNLNSPVPLVSNMDCKAACTSLGDSTNGLLLYAHSYYLPLWLQGSVRTTAVHNKNHDIIINGDSLIGRVLDGLTFINKPNEPNQFYLFQTDFSHTAGLFYSIIDPYFANDTGKVFEKNIQLSLTDTNIICSIFTVKHGNGRDWWLICRNWDNSNRFNLFLITPDSIIGPVEQNIGSITNSNGANMSISKQGDKIALVNVAGLIEVYNFDRCNGQISLPVTITVNQPFRRYFGCEFSPNGNLLYVSVTDNIFFDSLRVYQFDLTNVNPSWTVQKIYCQKVPASGGLMKRGPDDKIYLACLYEFGWPYPDSVRNIYNENLSVINNPDVYGPGCNFAPFSFYLGGKRSYWNLPNNPNFLLGPLNGSVCDSLTTGITNIKYESDYSLFPNPATNRINVTGNFISGSEYQIYNYEGKLVKNGRVLKNYTGIDVANLKNGIYLFSINRKFNKKFIIEK